MTDIISPLPFTLANGNTGDGSQVQANFDQIRNDVNQNVGAAIFNSRYEAAAFSTTAGVPYNGVNQVITRYTTLVDTSSILSGNFFVVPAGVTKVRFYMEVRSSNLANIDSLYFADASPTPTQIFPLSTPAIPNTALSEYSYVSPIVITTPGTAWRVLISTTGNVTLQDESRFEMEVLG